MPIYAYRCADCGHAKDVLQRMSDPLLSVCPACGRASLVKQLTAAGFQLKGSGWYATDFKGGTGGAAATPSGDRDAATPSGDSGAAKPVGASTESAPVAASAPAPAGGGGPSASH